MKRVGQLFIHLIKIIYLFAAAWLLTSPAHATPTLVDSIGEAQLAGIQASNISSIFVHDKTLWITDHSNVVHQWQQGSAPTVFQQGDKKQRFISALRTSQNKFVLLDSENAQLLISKERNWQLFSREGDQEGEIKQPASFAWSKHDIIYIADANNNRISAFSGTGLFLFTFGNDADTEDLNLKQIIDIATDNTGRVYVLDDDLGGRISIYSPLGELDTIIGKEELDYLITDSVRLSALTVRPDGTLIFADKKSGRIFEVDWENMELLSSFGTIGKGRGQLSRVSGLSLDSDGKLYVADRGNRKIEIFQLDWKQSSTVNRNADLLSIHSSSVLMSPCEVSYIYTAEQTLCINTKENSVTLRSHDGVILQTLEADFKKPTRAAFDQNEIIILDRANVKVFDNEGKFKFEFAGSGRRDGELSQATSLALTSTGVYVTDTGNERIQVFSRNGLFQQSIGNDKTSETILLEPTSVAVDNKGHVYVADQELHHVLIYSAKGKLLEQLGFPAEHAHEFITIHDLFIDHESTLYILASTPANPLSVWMYKDSKLIYRFSPTVTVAKAGFDKQWQGSFTPSNNADVQELISASQAALESTVELTLDLSTEPMAKLFAPNDSFFDDAAWIFNRVPNNHSALTLVNLNAHARHTFTTANTPEQIQDITIAGDEKTLEVSWLSESKDFSGYYTLYGRKDISSPFEIIQKVVQPHMDIQRNQFEYTEYRVSAVSALGKESALSPIYQDDFWSGYQAYQTGNLDGALELLKQVTTSNSQHATAWLYLGKTQLQLKAYEDANKTFAQLGKFEGWAQQSMHLQAETLTKKQAWIDVKTLVDLAESNGNADAVLHSLAANALTQMDDIPSAIYYLNQAVALEPTSPTWHLSLAEANYALGAEESGKAELLEAAKLAGKDEKSWVEIARSYSKHKLYDDAASSYARALIIAPSHAQALPELAMLHLTYNHLDEARTTATKMAGIQQLKGSSYYILGRVALAENKAPQALAMLAKAGQSNPNDASIWLAMADAYAALDKPDRETEYLEKSNALDTGNFEVHLRLARSCTSALNHTCATEHYTQAVELDKTNSNAHLGLARNLITTGNITQANIHAEAALAVEPSSIDAHLILAEIQSMRGMIPASIATLKRAMVLDDANMALHLNLSKAYIANQMYAEASQTTDQAMLLDVRNPAPIMLSGSIYLARQSFDEAIAAFEKAVALAPNQPKYQQQLNMAYLQKKRLIDSGGNMLGPKLKNLEFARVFSAAYKQYTDIPVGTITLKNESGVDYSNVKVSLLVKEYMDFPTATTIEQIPAGGEINIPLLASFNNKILDIDEDTGVQSEVRAEYYLAGKPHTETLNEPMTIYGKNAIVWEKLDMVGSFATPKDDTLAVFIRQMVNTYNPKRGAINANVSKAMTVYNGLSAYGIRYLVDPNSPYDKLIGGQLDTVQFPRETLHQRSGDCDDLSILLAASLSNLGIETAILDVPAHLLMMFNTGVPESQKGSISLNDEALAIMDGMVWIPLEATLITSSFSEAWAEGARKYHMYGQQEKMKIMPLPIAWVTYPPVTLPPADYALTIPDESAIGDSISKEWGILSVKALERQVHPYRMMLSLDENNTQAQMQIAVVYARNGLYEHAALELESIRKKYPDNAAALNNLGNIHYMNQEYQKALSMYELALEADPNNPDMIINVAMTNYKIGDALRAKTLFDKAVDLDDQVPARYEQLSFLLHQ